MSRSDYMLGEEEGDEAEWRAASSCFGQRRTELDLGLGFGRVKERGSKGGAEGVVAATYPPRELAARRRGEVIGGMAPVSFLSPQWRRRYFCENPIFLF